HGTRMHDDIHLGGSPRASIALFRTSQALAAVNGRSFVLPDDVKRMVQPVLAHRIILRPESRLRKQTPAALLHEIVSDVRGPVPAHKDGDAPFADGGVGGGGCGVREGQGLGPAGPRPSRRASRTALHSLPAARLLAAAPATPKCVSFNPPLTHIRREVAPGG